MKKIGKKIIATIVSITLVISIPIASKVITQVDAADYQLVWSDEFDGTTLNTSNWTVETGTGQNGWGNNEQQYYRNSSENIEVSDGTLKIHALKQSWGGKKYTSARMKTQGKQSFKYGKIEAKMKLPRFKGSWPAFWMLGENISSVGWPKCGEMDIMEAINDNNYVYSNLHWSYNNNTRDTKGNAHNVGDRTEWHTYGMEWDKNIAKFYVDDSVTEEYEITTAAQMEEFREKQFIILNLAIGGNWPGQDIDVTAFPDKSTMEVDYVRVYQKPEEVTTKYDGPTIVKTHDAVAEYQGGWQSWIGTDWLQSEGTVTQNGSKPSSGFTADITKVGSYDHVDAVWSFQAILENLTYYTGCTYTYKCEILSDKDKRIYVKVADSDQNNMAGGYIDLRANKTTYFSVDVVIPSDFDSTISLKFGMGNNSEDKFDADESFNIKVKNVSFKTTTWAPDPDYTTTPGPTTTEEPTTEMTTAETTTVETTTEETTTKAPTTVVPSTVSPVTVVPTSKTPVTVAPATKASGTNKKSSTAKKKTTTVKLKKAKIKKVIRKKKSLKVKIKKIKGASGYQVKFSDNKKFDGYWTKNSKKATVKLKKLDRKTKYYIKARAYRKVGSTRYYGKFSKRKKVKTK